MNTYTLVFGACVLINLSLADSYRERRDWLLCVCHVVLGGVCFSALIGTWGGQ